MTFVKSLLNLIIFLSTDNNKKDFVLYCESRFYRDHFVDLIDNLLSLDQKNVIIVTSNIDPSIFVLTGFSINISIQNNVLKHQQQTHLCLFYKLSVDLYQLQKFYQNFFQQI